MGLISTTSASAMTGRGGGKGGMVSDSGGQIPSNGDDVGVSSNGDNVGGNSLRKNIAGGDRYSESGSNSDDEGFYVVKNKKRKRRST